MFKKMLFVLTVSANLVFSQDVVINEIMASNEITIVDEDGDASDWLELYNRGTGPIGLSGYGLSDDVKEIRKWQFGDVVIEPAEHLIVFASDKNRETTYWHTNFKISASGESILLCNASGAVVDQVVLPASSVDIAYGRTTDGSPGWMFQSPTPGSGNTGIEILGTADEITASLPGGFYTSTISVELSAGDCRIFYTINGSDPDSNKTEYTAPINIQKTTVVRAMSIKPHYRPSPVFCQTYFINENTDLPVISLSSDQYNLFDENYGIYTNFRLDAERPAHIEFFDDARNPVFSKDCIISLHGAQSREWAQKSFSVKFKDGIDALEYSLFADFNVTTFKSFLLRNSGNDFQYTHIRDAMMQRLVKDLDVDYQEYRPATAFINGEYWGIYNIREKINEHYIANRHGVDPDNIDMLEDSMTVIHGDNLYYRQLMDYIGSNDMTTAAAYAFIDSMVDLDECILYFAAQAYYDNMDWPGGNIKYWRERNERGKWRWILFDLDFGFGLYAHGPWEDHIAFMFATSPTRYSNPPWATLLQRKLVENPAIRNQFINQIADLLNTNFKSERVVTIINEMAEHIANEIPRHRKRFGINGENLSKLTSFAQERPAYLRDHVRNFFRCGSNVKLTIHLTEGGLVKLNTLNLEPSDSPWTGVYFQRNAVHLTAVAKPGYKFDGWSGSITGTDASLTISGIASTDITASFSADSNKVKTVVINEINYNSSDAFDSGDWIELYNSSSVAMDIGEWSFMDSEAGHEFAIPTGTILQPNAYLVLVEDEIAFTSCYPLVENFIGEINFGLSASGERIRLFDKYGQIVDSLTYDDESPWPIEANGKGATLELFDPALDNADGENWRALAGNGSPGRLNYVSLSVEKNSTVPEKFSLMQNYPNPFNLSTVISYQISKPLFVKLSVYDVNGRLIETLLSEHKKPGYYSVHWNAGDAVSGLYFYRMNTGDLSIVKKCILIK